MKYNSRKVYAILEDQQFMYYSDFDKVSGEPQRLQGVVNMRDGKVEKVKTQVTKHGFHIRSMNWKGSGVFGTDGAASCSSWYGALHRSITLHSDREEKLEAPRRHRASLGLPQDGQLQKKEITRAYKKMSLKHHPDRGGDKEEFHRIQDAYAAIMSIQEIEEVEKNSILVDYEVVLEKTQGGLGIVVKEDAKGRVGITKIETKISIISMSDEADGAIKVGDILVAIDNDDCSEWPLSRIKGRLGPARVSSGETVLFTFERRVMLREDEEEESGAGASANNTAQVVHPSWDNSFQYTSSPSSPNEKSFPMTPRPYSRSRPSLDHLISLPSFSKAYSEKTETKHEMVSIETSEATEKRGDNLEADAAQKRRESLKEGLRNIEEFEEEKIQEVLYAPSPMTSGSRGSIKEMSFENAEIEPLHRIEELFDLLEVLRKGDARATASRTDAFALKELIAREHERATKSQCRTRTDDMIARLTSLRYSAALEGQESFSNLAKNLGISESRERITLEAAEEETLRVDFSRAFE